MGKKAVDVVLLPDAAMTQAAIQANRMLVREFGSKIVLNTEEPLPHISLCMGCLEEADIEVVGNLLKEAAGANVPTMLRVSGIRITKNAVGEEVCSFEIARTEQLQALHEQIMHKLTPYLSYDVTEDMLFAAEPMSESTLLWIRNYREKSSFANFRPHITIGYGGSANLSYPAKFRLAKLTLCQLGNHCTCRKVLASVELGAN